MTLPIGDICHEQWTSSRSPPCPLIQHTSRTSIPLVVVVRSQLLGNGERHRVPHGIYILHAELPGTLSSIDSSSNLLQLFEDAFASTYRTLLIENTLGLLTCTDLVRPVTPFTTPWETMGADVKVAKALDVLRSDRR
ncbi:hypothetical protein M409DRAFT_59066 [Zasmidium cellare ATCC 36951]|uniref:Uncharacterized protein n=1 Tax=Zasmidium cellare ATCC 36951 TaxID=1080233 RepID=A0A6A6C604_ZASCE|nr:uncharacterized protein M409DRAFT_59066 [Zasmidium cellare ATCC 36951]KAF2161688.1 hypothetical protein M409DRAFT_59066 [Zasmidium cellare ATCC 36951]